jgi:ferritin
MNRKVTTLSVKVINLLNEQIQHELANYSIYMTFASELSLLGYKDGEKYYLCRAHEEKKHAQMIMHYMRLNDAPVSIKTIDIPQYDIVDISIPFIETVNREIFTTEKLNECYEAGIEGKDYAFTAWLANGLLKLQVEDEEPESRIALSIINGEGSDLGKMSAILELVEKEC